MCGSPQRLAATQRQNSGPAKIGLSFRSCASSLSASFRRRLNVSGSSPRLTPRICSTRQSACIRSLSETTGPVHCTGMETSMFVRFCHSGTSVAAHYAFRSLVLPSHFILATLSPLDLRYDATSPKHVHTPADIRTTHTFTHIHINPWHTHMGVGLGVGVGDGVGGAGVYAHTHTHTHTHTQHAQLTRRHTYIQHSPGSCRRFRADTRTRVHIHPHTDTLAGP